MESSIPDQIIDKYCLTSNIYVTNIMGNSYISIFLALNSAKRPATGERGLPLDRTIRSEMTQELRATTADGFEQISLRFYNVGVTGRGAAW